MTILLHDDFDGSGLLIGHTPDTNTLGAGGVWTGGGSVSNLSGGALVASPGAGNYAAGSLFDEEGQGHIGAAVRITFRWTPGGAPADYAAWSYPLGLNFQCARIWMTANGSSVSMLFAAGDQDASVGVSFSGGSSYEGTITVEDGHQTLNFLGHVLELAAEVDIAALHIQPVYLNLYTTADGSSSGALDFIKVETLAEPSFWTRLRNAVEIP